MNNVYIYKEKTEKNPYKVVIMQDTMFHFASFNNMEQFKKFLVIFDVKLEYLKTYNPGTPSEVKHYRTNYFLDGKRYHSFWKYPRMNTKHRKFIKALSNGSIVNCILERNEKDKIIYLKRPNPNAKDVYCPLDTWAHIEYQKEYGIF